MQLHINTYGTYVHVRDQMFEVRRKLESGEIDKKPYSPQKVTHIIMATGTMLSTDAIKLAMQNNVDIVFVEQDGEPLGRVWHSKLGSTTKIRKAQLEASLSAVGVRWVKSWLLTKMDNQLQFIKDLKKHRPQHADFLNDKLTRMEALCVSVHTLEASRVTEIADTLRGLEGTAGRLYFETLSYVLPKEYQFSGRSNRPARDAFNAFLNYAYGILYSKTEKSLIIAGIDPYVGFLHRDDYNQLSMVYDFIEPYRIYADEVVFRLFSAKKVNKAHTSPLVNRNGEAGATLNAEGKALLVGAFNEFMDGDPVRHRGRNLKRSQILQSDAHQFANELIQKNERAKE
ncbi:CRISPR-associated endonuclease Cas1 [Siphonobacter sp. SORGH_AS_1065]|uniref:CRISPR-associated endonuclease Cas1 n=1 Tax=Siphonobacter sp. SORGH_AS_1065 TaxID=3041795 RepID=UPI002789ADDB|nr:CRISPR-associated endonuclease Cas1 [Siphonobacter sp. SORGH_AS_1065]MDQ1086157.1 CRISPR-associated protein Cas1 [Siphonobacter sp. SORGH_AS_1065]